MATIQGDKDDSLDAVAEAIANYEQEHPEEQLSEISLLLPDELKRSFANEEFENPIPSRL